MSAYCYSIEKYELMSDSLDKLEEGCKCLRNTFEHIQEQLSSVQKIVPNNSPNQIKEKLNRWENNLKRLEKDHIANSFVVTEQPPNTVMLYASKGTKLHRSSQNLFGVCIRFLGWTENDKGKIKVMPEVLHLNNDGKEDTRLKIIQIQKNLCNSDTEKPMEFTENKALARFPEISVNNEKGQKRTEDCRACRYSIRFKIYMKNGLKKYELNKLSLPFGVPGDKKDIYLLEKKIVMERTYMDPVRI
uniref:Uncharacterized protein n=1 Tax=Acrobeloides nanus TaxID=290746 RepID=A0A914DBL6_9BILA